MNEYVEEGVREVAKEIIGRLLAELVTANITVYVHLLDLYHQALKPGLEGDRAYAEMQQIKDQIKMILKGEKK